MEQESTAVTTQSYSTFEPTGRLRWLAPHHNALESKKLQQEFIVVRRAFDGAYIDAQHEWRDVPYEFEF